MSKMYIFEIVKNSTSSKKYVIFILHICYFQSRRKNLPEVMSDCTRQLPITVLQSREKPQAEFNGGNFSI